MSWFLVFVLGFVFINVIAFRVSILEKLGFSIPIGIGLNTLFLILIDMAGVAINNKTTILVMNIVLLLVVLGLFFVRNKDWVKNFKLDLKIDWNLFKNINLGWLLLLGFLFYVIYGISTKSLFWPVYIYDSAAGYDFIAKAIFREGSFDNSIFDPNYPLYSVRSVYPPLVPLAFSMAYVFGGLSSKIIGVFFYCSTFLVFYSFIRKYVTDYAAALFALLLAISPEFAAFSALSSPNPPCTFYASMGLLSMYVWYKDGEQGYFNLGVFSLMLAMWTRTESIMFVAGGGFLVLLNVIKTKKHIRLAYYSFIPMSVFFFWQWYLNNVLETTKTNPIVEHLAWDGDKLARMMKQVSDVTFSTQYYGITVFLFLILILLNAYYIYKEKDSLVLLITIFIPWLLYMAIYYIIDTDYKEGSVAWIGAGYKRGFFYFLPLMLFYAANNKIMKAVFKNVTKI